MVDRYLEKKACSIDGLQRSRLKAAIHRHTTYSHCTIVWLACKLHVNSCPSTSRMCCLSSAPDGTPSVASFCLSCRVSGRYTYPIHTGGWRYTYCAGGVGVHVVTPRHEWLHWLVSGQSSYNFYQSLAVLCCGKCAYTDRQSGERLLTDNRILFSRHEN